MRLCKFSQFSTTNQSANGYGVLIEAEIEKQRSIGMKLIINGLMVACLLVTLAGATVLGNTRKSIISFSADTKVNGALVKKGKYEATFDDQSGELSIFKGAKLIAKTSARLEKRDRKARDTQVQTILEGMDQKLVSITFSGSDENLVVKEAGMQAGGN
jgi:hypothetical protein